MAHITVNYQNGYFSVWSAEDALTLRQKYRIVGYLLGACPEFPRAIENNGLPLILRHVEVRLLLELDAIRIVCDSADSWSQHLKDAFNVDVARELTQSDFRDFNEHFKHERLEEIDSKFELIVTGKLKKQKRELDSSELATFRSELHTQLLNGIRDLSPNDTDMTVRFRLSSPYISSTSETPYILPDLMTHHETLLYQTFKHFWSKGYFVADGRKFGADYSVYDDDPLMFHAKFTVLCSPDANFRERFLKNLTQCYGRMSKNIRKNILIATFEEENDHDSDNQNQQRKIKLQHVQWTTLTQQLPSSTIATTKIVE